MNYGILLAGRKTQLIILKSHLYFPKENQERKLCQGAREISLNLLSYVYACYGVSTQSYVLT